MTKIQTEDVDIDSEIETYFFYIARYYREKADFTLTAVFQFVFLYGKGAFPWCLRVDRDTIAYSEGQAEKPDITITTSYSLWLKISSGKKNATLEYLKKSYRIKGALSFLLAFNSYFGSIIADSRKTLSKKTDTWEFPRKRKWEVPDPVVVINASPRMKKGFTYRFLKPFLTGLSSRAPKVEVIDLYDSSITIEPCRGCEACWNGQNGLCVIKDDGNAIMKKILAAKLTVFAMPLYVDSMPAKLKALLDRFFVQTKPQFEMDERGVTRHPLVDLKERYFALFAVCGFPEMRHFKPLVATFADIGRNFHAPILANILRPGSQYLYLNPLMFFERLAVERALVQAGEQLACRGQVRRKTLKEIGSDCNVPAVEWQYYANTFWDKSNKDEL